MTAMESQMTSITTMIMMEFQMILTLIQRTMTMTVLMMLRITTMMATE